MDQLGKFGGLTWQILGKQGGRCPTVAQIDEILWIAEFLVLITGPLWQSNVRSVSDIGIFWHRIVLE